MLSQAQRGHAKGKERKKEAEVTAGLIKHPNLHDAGDSSINSKRMSIFTA